VKDMSDVKPDATTDEILETIREIRSLMTSNRDPDVAADLGAQLADLTEALDERLSWGGEPLPQAWQRGPNPSDIVASLVRTEVEYSNDMGHSESDPSRRTATHIARRYADAMEGAPGFDRRDFLDACKPESGKQGSEG
jgi:hypothetical protein